MDEKEFPSLFIWLALRAALCGVSLVTIYTALAQVMLWVGLAPK
jgi:hypothetical protein